jgi:hypothetical protein
MRSDVLSKPDSEIGLIELPAGEGEDEDDNLFLRCFNAKAVQAKEEIHGLKSDALVPVNKGVVLGKAKTICCSKGGQIRVRAVVEPVSRTFDSRLQKTPVSESKGPAVSFDLIRMDCEDVYESEPAGFVHLASSRMAFR